MPFACWKVFEMTQRYERQSGLIGQDGQMRLFASRVAVIGCGGLGSSVISNLVSAGLGHIVLVDGDIVTESNLNRQFIHAGSVGTSKVESARSWILNLNPDCEVVTHAHHLTERDRSIIEGVDVVVDCLDNPESRLMLGRMCIDSDIVLVHAAVDGYHGQVAVLWPDGSLRMEHIYPRSFRCGDRSAISTAVSIVGSLEANQVIDVIIGSNDVLRDEILTVDVSEMSMVRHQIRG